MQRLIYDNELEIYKVNTSLFSISQMNYGQDIQYTRYVIHKEFSRAINVNDTGDSKGGGGS